MDDVVLTADMSAENRCWLRAHLGDRPLRAMDKDELLALIEARHGAALRDEAIHGLAWRFPELSAQTVVTRAQVLLFSLLAAVVMAGLVLHPAATWRFLVALLSVAFGVCGIFRTVLALLGARRPADLPVTPSEALPRYTILVPLYREAAVLAQLVQGLQALDYPPALLDIKLVVEADDAETIAAALAAHDTATFEIIRVPPGGPRTKPKAANYALAFARGEYLVVYDAEDRPQPDQLKKAVATFRASPRNTACLQARLTIDNCGQNWLTRGIMAQTPLAKARCRTHIKPDRWSQTVVAKPRSSMPA